MKFTKTRKSEWFTNPTMCGEIWSQETVATAEAIITKYAKTKRTKALANYVIRDIPSGIIGTTFQKGIEYASFRVA